MTARDPIEPEGLFDGLSGGAILLGALVDFAATMLLSSLIVAWIAPGAFSPDDAEATRALDALYASGSFAWLELGIGLLCTVFGAFVGARRAGRLHVRHGGWVAVASTALAALFVVIAPPETAGPEVSLGVQVLGWILILPAGVAGGALARVLAADPDATGRT